MAIYDLYGVLSTDMMKAKITLEAALEICFEARESSYQGGDYFVFGKKTDENFVLKRNLDPIDGEAVEIKFPEYSILLHVNNTPRSSDLLKKIDQKANQFVLLKHEDL